MKLYHSRVVTFLSFPLYWGDEGRWRDSHTDTVGGLGMESQMLLGPVCCVFWTKVALFQHTFLINNQSSSGSVKALLILQETVANPPPVSDKLNKNSLAFRGKGEETFRPSMIHYSFDISRWPTLLQSSLALLKIAAHAELVIAYWCPGLWSAPVFSRFVEFDNF